MRQILIIALVAGLAHACSCMPPGSPLEELAKSDAVFSGTVTSVVQDSFGYTVTFQAERAWKGVDTQTVKVHTAQDSAGCGYAFTEGEKYVVYAYRDDEGALGTNLCSRTARLAEARADVDALGQGTVISQPKGGLDAGMLAAVVLVLAGLGLLAWFAMKKK